MSMRPKKKSRSKFFGLLEVLCYDAPSPAGLTSGHAAGMLKTHCAERLCQFTSPRLGKEAPPGPPCRPRGWRKPFRWDSRLLQNPGRARRVLPRDQLSAHTHTDTQRAVEILARYQRFLRPPVEQPLQASLEKVLSLFRSELFQALLDIQECYELSLLSACKQDGTTGPGDGSPPPCRDGAVTKGYLERHGQDRKAQQGTLRGQAAGDPDSARPPRLVKVTESRTELPAHVRSLVVGVRSSLPKQEELSSDSLDPFHTPDRGL
nr:disks large homolog 1-like [Pogona vitticeps]